MRPLLPLVAAFAAAPAIAIAQEHVHQPGMSHDQPPVSARQPGQSAFAAVAEVVALLVADSATDWSRVDIEALRQHLIDMDEVTLRSTVRAEPVPGGARFVVTGTGRTVGAIRRMATAHAGTIESPWHAVVEARAGGVTLTVTSSVARDEARIRGLGFIGLLTVGEHHGAHHLAIARGAMPPGHTHR